nr:U23_MYRTX_Ta1a [Tetramorium africanum]
MQLSHLLLAFVVIFVMTTMYAPQVQADGWDNAKDWVEICEILPPICDDVGPI